MPLPKWPKGKVVFGEDPNSFKERRREAIQTQAYINSLRDPATLRNSSTTYPPPPPIPRTPPARPAPPPMRRIPLPAEAIYHDTRSQRPERIERALAMSIAESERKKASREAEKARKQADKTKKEKERREAKSNKAQNATRQLAAKKAGGSRFGTGVSARLRGYGTLSG